MEIAKCWSSSGPGPHRRPACTDGEADGAFWGLVQVGVWGRRWPQACWELYFELPVLWTLPGSLRAQLEFVSAIRAHVGHFRALCLSCQLGSAAGVQAAHSHPLSQSAVWTADCLPSSC